MNTSLPTRSSLPALPTNDVALALAARRDIGEAAGEALAAGQYASADDLLALNDLEADGRAARAELSSAHVRLCWDSVQRVPVSQRDDAFGEAQIALMEAVQKWSPERGATFEKYACGQVRRAVSTASQHQSAFSASPRTRKQFASISAAKRSFEESGHKPTPAEIAERAERSDVTANCYAMQYADRFEGLVDDVDAAYDRATVTDFVSPLEDADAACYLLSHLTDDLKTTLVLLMGLDRGSDERTQTEVAAVLGVSKMAVSKRVMKARGIISALLEADADALTLACA